jgi:hypothetical protein
VVVVVVRGMELVELVELVAEPQVLIMQQIQPHLEQLILAVAVGVLVDFLLQEVVVQVDLGL